MKTRYVILSCIAFSFMTIWILANRIEEGDINAVSMYYVVFLIPAIIIALLNGMILMASKLLEKNIYKRIISIIPILFLITIVIEGHLQIPILDGKFSFVGKIGLISVGLTNLIWNIKLQ